MFKSVFADPGWIAFIEKKHGLQHRILKAGTEGSDTAYAEVLVFLNKKGKIRPPRLMPFMPTSFQHTQTESLTKIQRQWLSLGGEIAEQMNEIGWGGSIALEPEIIDIRPWQWQGMSADVRYTYRFPLPKDLSTTSSAVRRNIKKAQRANYTIERTTNAGSVIECLNETEDRQSFGYGLKIEDIQFLLDNMTDDTFRIYEARNENGELAAARVVLAPAGGVAMDLVSGTFKNHLSSGVTQMAIAHTLSDLHATGVECFDFEGANIHGVASAKMEWGAELVPFYLLSHLGPRSMALQGKRWLARKLRMAGK